jgi:hypothetical protein
MAELGLLAADAGQGKLPDECRIILLDLIILIILGKEYKL